MIKIDMPMPQCCYECRFNASGCSAMPRRFDWQIRDEYDSEYLGEESYMMRRMSWCPLIDADENGGKTI